MKIKLLKDREYRGRKYKKDAVLDVDRALSEKLLLNGIAVIARGNEAAEQAASVTLENRSGQSTPVEDQSGK